MDASGYVQGGVLALLGTVITVLFTVRASNKVKNDNAGDNRKSRYEDLVQDRLDSAL